MAQQTKGGKPKIPLIPNDRRKRRTISQKDQIEFWTSVGIFIPRRTIYLGPVHTDAEGNESATDASLFQRIVTGLEVLEYFSPKDPITIVMNNPGGSWYHGMALFDRVRNSPCEITIEGYGYVMSMGAVIFQAAHRRLLARHSTFLLHYGREAFEGHSLDAIKAARETERLNALMEDILLRQINKKRRMDEQKEMDRLELRAEISFDRYFEPKEAIQWGLADGYAKKSSSLATAEDDLE
jgi:ATP-dependent Clp protease protease subunit